MGKGKGKGSEKGKKDATNPYKERKICSKYKFAYQWQPVNDNLTPAEEDAVNAMKCAKYQNGRNWKELFNRVAAERLRSKKEFGRI